MKPQATAFLLLRLADYWATVREGGIEIEGNPVAVYLGLEWTVVLTSLFGLTLVLWTKSQWGMRAILLVACIPFIFHFLCWVA